jgi:peptide/nickel transport system permease protein
MSSRAIDATAARRPRLAVGTETQWQLIWGRFCRHHLAVVSAVILTLLYLAAIFAELLAPGDPHAYNARYTFAPPQPIHLLDRDEAGSLVFRPYVNDYTVKVDPVALRRTFAIDPEKKHPLRLFAKSEPYLLMGLIPMERKLLSIEDKRTPLLLLGADRLGRDVLSRLIHGTRISLSVGLIGVTLSSVIGLAVGGLSGYYGGLFDLIAQRVIEFLRSLPTIPLWMGFATALPRDWSALTIYFAITLILALLGWTELARVVRGRFLSLKTEDYVIAARLDGASDLRVVFRHMMPALTSHIIAAVSLALPAMILAETSLSFLGLGLQAPIISWGVLLQEAQNIRAVATAPWLLWPAAAVIVAVLAMNFIGDGLRDAADPYAT